MVIVKLFVIAVFFIVVFANSSEYCKICPNHTLCVYPMPGPGLTCKGYDASALLTRDDIISIVSRVNQRRNFVALGLSKLLPTAANMRKMSWSEDLAWSAQRWVDQCDPAVQPDTHDLCRNLEDTLVGQNIATIFGPSPGLGVKSLVDIWYMQTLDYSGKVSFYNESQDASTKYFSQLIWAETDSIGCGKARFYIEYTVVERLVCNFAPSGNIHGKPVYAIGIPATQCPENFRPDETYAGLCKLQSLSTVYSLLNPLTSRLLKISNLTNNTAKQQRDPSSSNSKLRHVDGDENDDHKHHKSRHVVNNSQADLSHLLPQPMLWNNFNDSRNPLIHHNQPDIIHPRVYHGHIQRENFVPPYTAPNQQNFRRYDMLTQPPFPVLETQARENYRKFNDVNQCTRHSRLLGNCNNCNSPFPCISNRCTRGQNHGCNTPPCISSVQKVHAYPHDDCPCSLPTTCSPPTSQTPCCGVTCHCPCHIATPSTCCPHIAREGNPISIDKTRKSEDLHYYDLFPNLALRAGDSTSENPIDKSDIPNHKKIWLSHNDKSKIVKHKRREYHFPKRVEQLKHDLEFPNDMEEARDYINRSFDSRRRQKRKLETKSTFNPFWKLDEYDTTDHSIIMKSLQYTTLRNKKIKHTWRTAHNSVTGITSTEPITIEVKSYEGYNNQDNVDSQHGTEKYLSFDELMHLRKLNIGNNNARRFGGRQTTNPGKSLGSAPSALPRSEIGVTLRSDTQSRSSNGNPPQSFKTNFTRTDLGFRKADVASTKVPPPVNYTVTVTPKLVKHCTRRLTCTWTAAMNTNKDGSVNNAPIIPGVSRTPPGYVEGCTRTSTCTRDFMNRNKITTTPMSTLVPGEEVADEDYCERRSLDVKKRNANKEHKTGLIVKRHKMFKKHLNLEKKDTIRQKNNSRSGTDIRIKRNVVNNKMLKSNHYLRHRIEGQCRNPMMSYGDLYYLVLNKLTKTWELEKRNKKHRKCSCNSSNSKWNDKILLILVLQNFITVMGGW